jgi:hypothetical protein
MILIKVQSVLSTHMQKNPWMLTMIRTDNMRTYGMHSNTLLYIPVAMWPFRILKNHMTPEA